VQVRVPREVQKPVVVFRKRWHIGASTNIYYAEYSGTFYIYVGGKIR